MTIDVFRQNIWVVLFLLLVGGGLIVEAWNQQEIQSCHDKYDDDPTVAVECEDSFTGMMHYVSLFSISIGVVGILWSMANRIY